MSEFFKHTRPDMFRPSTDQEAFEISVWLRVEEQWYEPAGGGMVEGIHALKKLTQKAEVQEKGDEDNGYFVQMSCGEQALRINSLEDLVRLQKWSFNDASFEEDTAVFSEERQTREYNRVLCYRAVIYAAMGMFQNQEE